MTTAFQSDAFQNNAFQIDAPPVVVVTPTGGGDSTGYRRSRRVLRRLIKRNPAVREQLEEFYEASAGHQGDEISSYRTVLSEFLGRAVDKKAVTVNALIRESIVSDILASIDRDEEQEEESIVLRALH